MDPPRRSSTDVSRQSDESQQSADRARDMIEVHGPGAAGVARENARSAAMAGRVEQARNWRMHPAKAAGS